MNKYFRQLFTVEAGTIVTTDIEPAISIDHNERLVAGVESLQTILGVTELTPMPTGSLVKQYKYTKRTHRIRSLKVKQSGLQSTIEL